MERTSILKKSLDINRLSTNKKTGPSTGIGQSVAFKEANEAHYEVDPFREDSPLKSFR